MFSMPDRTSRCDHLLLQLWLFPAVRSNRSINSIFLPARRGSSLAHHRPAKPERRYRANRRCRWKQSSYQNKTFHAQHPANRRSSPAYTVTRSGQYSGYPLYARPIILWRGADKRQPAIREQVKLPFPHPYCYSCTTNQCFARSGAF